jgi:cytochrome c biogenesis protein CcmG/thiol:disulfide interchange protein DsbE
VNRAGEAASRASLLTWIFRMLGIGSVGLFIALLVYGLAAQSPNDTIDERLRASRSAPAPGFSLAVLEKGTLPRRLQRTGDAMADGQLALSELRGTAVVLNFWASWCPPCQEEAPRLQRGWVRWGERGVLFLGLDMQDFPEDARDFLREFGITYPTIRDPGKDVANDYGATGLPETYFISATGRVVGHVIGVVYNEQLNSGVAAAPADRPVGARRGGARRPAR